MMMPFEEIRKYYAEELPELWDDFRKHGQMMSDPYRLEFQSYSTPIEDNLWAGIRYFGLPFLPQLPVLNYFVDFGNPFEKVAIECDGKKWHDGEKDAKRDARLRAAGWTVYRIPGWKCNKNKQEPWDKFYTAREEDKALDYESRLAYCRDWFCNTGDGVVLAIGMYHFNKDLTGEEYQIAARESLAMHCTARPSVVERIEADSRRRSL